MNNHNGCDYYDDDDDYDDDGDYNGDADDDILSRSTHVEAII